MTSKARAILLLVCFGAAVLSAAETPSSALLVLDKADNSLVIIDPSSKKIDWVLGTGQDRTHMVAVSNDGNKIFTTNVSSATVSIIERGPQAGNPGGRGPAPVDWHVTSIPVGRGAEGFDVSPDGSEMWVANAQDRTVSIIDVAGKNVAQTLDVSAARTNRLRFTPDGRLAFLSDPGGTDLVVIDRATRKEVKKIAVGRGGGGIQMVPDGSRAFVALGQDNAVVLVDVKTLTVTGRVSTGRNPDGLAWAVRK